mmetsp:Transcript_30081/g.79443  ORF Transcript_30081/g.79443 Transcript_30081/m.79443 type:complete len:443 (-) Transcript_30081:509-1837(-)
MRRHRIPGVDPLVDGSHPAAHHLPPGPPPHRALRCPAPRRRQHPPPAQARGQGNLRRVLQPHHPALPCGLQHRRGAREAEAVQDARQRRAQAFRGATRGPPPGHDAARHLHVHVDLQHPGLGALHQPRAAHPQPAAAGGPLRQGAAAGHRLQQQHRRHDHAHRVPAERGGAGVVPAHGGARELRHLDGLLHALLRGAPPLHLGAPLRALPPRSGPHQPRGRTRRRRPPARRRFAQAQDGPHQRPVGHGGDDVLHHRGVVALEAPGPRARLRLHGPGGRPARRYLLQPGPARLQGFQPRDQLVGADPDWGRPGAGAPHGALAAARNHLRRHAEDSPGQGPLAGDGGGRAGDGCLRQLRVFCGGRRHHAAHHRTGRQAAGQPRGTHLVHHPGLHCGHGASRVLLPQRQLLRGAPRRRRREPAWGLQVPAFGGTKGRDPGHLRPL